MPRHGPFIHQVYIADGFADDCDELIHRCLKEERVDYHIFCRRWKEMNMGCLYEGRSLGAEIAELSEEVIRVGKHYMLKDTANFEESVVGVFIVYALLELQPYKGFAHFRVIPEDLSGINRIEYVARRDKRNDVLYALGSILIKGPVEYHIAEREYGMELPIRKYLEGFTSIDRLGVRPKGVYRRQNEELDVLNEINGVIHRYHQTKMMISEKAQYDRGLQYIDLMFAKNLENSLMKLITGVQDKEDAAPVDDCEKILKSRRNIKEKAMKQEIKPVKHLVGCAENRNSNVSTGDSSKKGVKRKSKKSMKEDSKKKTTKAGKKRRIPINPAKKSRNSRLKNRLESISEHDESDTSVEDIVKESDDIVYVPDTKSKKTRKPSIDTKKKNKGKKTVTKHEQGDDQEIKNVKDVLANIGEKKQVSEGKKNVEEVEEGTSVQELDIEIDTLPVLIRTEGDGKSFEIEIIDEQKSKKPVVEPKLRTYKKKQPAFQKLDTLEDVTITKISWPELINPVIVSSPTNQFATLREIDGTAAKTPVEKQRLGLRSQAPIRLDKLIEKRDCKRVHIQSKFRRLGMLPIANFVSPGDLELDTESEESDNTDAESDTQSSHLGLDPIEEA